MTLRAHEADSLEEMLFKIVRTLPPQRVAQLVDFARFLETRELLLEEENAEEVAADNEKWDALLATEASQNLLDQLAEEALAQHRRGETKKMTFTSEGKIAPE